MPCYAMLCNAMQCIAVVLARLQRMCYSLNLRINQYLKLHTTRTTACCYVRCCVVIFYCFNFWIKYPFSLTNLCSLNIKVPLFVYIFSQTCIQWNWIDPKVLHPKVLLKNIVYFIEFFLIEFSVFSLCFTLKWLVLVEIFNFQYNVWHYFYIYFTFYIEMDHNITHSFINNSNFSFTAKKFYLKRKVLIV